jgi:hypothetical protein
VLSVCLLAVAGGMLAARILLRLAVDDGKARADPAPAAVGDAVPTSFGAIAIEHVQKLRGLSAPAVGGVTHFPSFVPAEQTQVQVVFSLANLRARPVTYSPEQFRLRAGRGEPEIVPRTSSLAPGTLEPGATIEAELGFVVLRDGSRLRLEFADPGRREPIVVDLGRTLRPRARAPGTEGHRH